MQHKVGKLKSSNPTRVACWVKRNKGDLKMRTHGEIIQAQDAILAETQKWMKMAKMELNHKREVVADHEKTILNQRITISAMDQKIDELEEEINDLKEALLAYVTKSKKLRGMLKKNNYVTIHIEEME